MIGNVSRGSSFGGLHAYLVHGPAQDDDRAEGLQDYLLGPTSNRALWTSVRNLPTDDPQLAARIMTATAAQNVRVQKPVYHLSLALEPGEELSRQQWEQVADRVLRDLGLDEHQVLIVAHDDTEHPHVHLMINRVHPQHLKAWHNGHDYYRVEKSLRHIERDMGLRQVPGHHYRLKDQERPEREGQETAGERARRERTGEPSWAEQVRFRTYNTLRKAESWRELENGLADEGLRLKRRGGGLVVTDGERMVKASRLYRRASYHWLESRFGESYEQWQERRHREVAPTLPATHRSEPSPGPAPTGRSSRDPATLDPADRRILFRASNVLRNARNWGELERGLAAQGLRLRRRGGGLVVTDGRHRLKASRIYRRGSYAWLEKRFGMSFEQWRRGRRELLDTVDRYRRAEREQAELEYRRATAHRKMQDAELLVRHRDEARNASRAAAESVTAVLRELYHPEAYRATLRRIAREARRDGWEATARRVAQRPRRYGRLRANPIRRTALQRQGRRLRRRLVLAAVELTVSRAARLVAGPAAHRAVRAAFASRREILALKARRGRKSLQALQLDVAKRALALGVSALSLTLCPRPLKVIRTAVKSARLVRSLGRAAQGVARGGR